MRFMWEIRNKKVIYLTFDCGYENGNTEPILDALKKHNAPATFFVADISLMRLEIAKRMVAEGHTVEPHLSPSGYVVHIGYDLLSEGDGRCGDAVFRDHGKRDGEILPSAAGEVQYGKS